MLISQYFKFNHIGYAVEDLSKSSNYFEILGYKSSVVYYDKSQKIEIVLMEHELNPIIELIHPLGQNNPLNRFFNKSDTTVPYHIAYSVDNINDAIEKLREFRFVPSMKISNAVAFNDAPFIFLTNPNTGLIELLELK